MADSVTFGDMIVIEGDRSATSSGILSSGKLDATVSLEASPASQDFSESAEWLVMSAFEEPDQTCQPVDFGENLRLVSPSQDKRLHFDGSDLSLWAHPDGSGNGDDNWTLLSGTGSPDGGEWMPSAPFVLRHCRTGKYIGGAGDEICIADALTSARRFSLAAVL
eukprot:TRINITY_DN32706_c0_g1_i1.p1 TRINITY_DN32706_c0_g1~~TRINITY_DN32706_c0_g1_i1.p1  ORF type:complete len:164 (+),score=24.58 TRINITY_DN32706_c0_g1_i1:180-671(+)